MIDKTNEKVKYYRKQKFVNLTMNEIKYLKYFCLNKDLGLYNFYSVICV